MNYISLGKEKEYQGKFLKVSLIRGGVLDFLFKDVKGYINIKTGSINTKILLFPKDIAHSVPRLKFYIVLSYKGHRKSFIKYENRVYNMETVSTLLSL